MLKVYSSSPTITKVKRVFKFNEMDDKTSEYLLDFSSAKSINNLHIDGGKLVTGLGIKSAEISTPIGMLNVPKFTTSKIKQVFVYYRYDRDKKRPDNYLIIRCENGHFYRLSLEKNNSVWEELPTIICIDDIMAINYRYNNKDVILFCSENLYLTMYDGESVKLISSAPRMTSITEHYGRIFVSTYGEGDVWFSDDYNPENWNVSLNEAGFIKFSDTLGKTIKVISFNDYVYIFREHGIYRLIAVGDQNNFELTKVVELDSKIYKDSISICKDKIVFLTSNGMYIFNGYDLKRIKENISLLENISEKFLSSCYFNGQYVVKFILENTNENCLISLNIDDGVLEVHKGISIRHFTPIKINNTSNCLVVLPDNNNSQLAMFDYSCSYMNTGLNYKYESIKCFFGDLTKNKDIHEIRVLSKFDLYITVVTDKGEYKYFVKGSNSFSKVKINKKTKWLKLIITGNKDANIEGLEIEYSEVK